MTTHNDYDDLGELDNTESESYPTFDVLNKIGMMRFMTIYDDIKDKMCSICCKEYRGFKKSFTDDDIKRKDFREKYTMFYCDTQLMSIQNNINIPVNPIKLLCCKTIMCSNCLIQHIKLKKGEPECPYCRKNHTQYKKKYIIFDERYINKRL
jgi:hypothetical protein